jgi:Coatomer epsilon subunit
MTDPDDLYTLRAQYWMGHYQLTLDEAKSVARRPMSSALKLEREEFSQRAYLGLGEYNKVIGGETAGEYGFCCGARVAFPCVERGMELPFLHGLSCRSSTKIYTLCMEPSMRIQYNH